MQKQHYHNSRKESNLGKRKPLKACDSSRGKLRRSLRGKIKNPHDTKVTLSQFQKGVKFWAKESPWRRPVLQGFVERNYGKI
jgi:hypothetical protein